MLARRRREKICFVAHSKQNLHVFLNFLENIFARSAVSIRQWFKSNVRPPPPPPPPSVRIIITFCEEDPRVARMLVALASLKL